MDDRGKSILLQVAFKAAVAVEVPTEDQVISFYELLIGLHERLGINPTETKRSGGGRSSTPRTTQPTGETFILDGQLYTDFRQVKATGSVKANYPDFKRDSDGQAFWLYTQDGEPNAEAADLVSAADGKVF
jgi:hypothetical protein